MTVLPERRLHVAFDEPQFAVTPGQAVVCYDADDNRARARRRLDRIRNVRCKM